jgi:hypothetical protein
MLLLASPFKSKSRLEAEIAALRHQLIVLQRKVRGRVLFRVALDAELSRQCHYRKTSTSRWVRL